VKLKMIPPPSTLQLGSGGGSWERFGVTVEFGMPWVVGGRCVVCLGLTNIGQVAQECSLFCLVFVPLRFVRLGGS